MNMKQFGGTVTKELMARYAKSDNWRKNKFWNLEETTMNLSFQTIPKLLYKQFFETRGRMPPKPLPIHNFDKTDFLQAEQASFIWYGHAVVLIRMQGLTILIDPMMGPNASPIAPFQTKRFSKNTLDIIDDLPDIDLLLLTHDHYDHLDLASFNKLKGKVDKYYVALGTARHLQAWGVDPAQIKEFDWWDSDAYKGLNITFTPTRHFSGRGLTDRAQSIWGGWVLKSATENIYFSGDGGYGAHFKEVGERLGPFDFGFMECGQYNQNWHQIHMFPEESVQAAVDAGVQAAMPFHWAGFALAQHHWTDPVERFVATADKLNFKYQVPAIGQLFTAKDNFQDSWWEL